MSESPHFKQVVVIVSAPRSGSSFLYSLLCRHPDVVSLGGEETPFYKLCKNDWSRFRDERDLILQQDELSHFWHLIKMMVGRRSTQGELHFEHYHQRFNWQWQHYYKSPTPQLKREKAESAVDLLKKYLNQLIPELGDVDAAALYDQGLLGADLKSQYRGDGTAESSLFEDRPYAWPIDHRQICFEDFSQSTLVLKTSTNSYRLPWLSEIFKESKVHYVHLRRRVEASVQGLIDGWAFAGFHSFNIHKLFNLQRPDGSSWWKFDLFPGWQSYLNASVPEIALFQWLENQKAAWEFFNSNKAVNSPHVVYYDELCRADGREEVVRKLFQQLELSPFDLSNEYFLPKVMQTSALGPERWRTQEGFYRELLDKYPEVGELTKEMNWR